MGVYASKNKNNSSGLMEKTGFLQKEMREMISEWEKESKGYERDMMIFAFKEAEWKQERKRLRGEVKSLRKMVEEKEDKIRGIMGEKKTSNDQKDQWEMLGISSFMMVEQMREERARRDETVEKWKQLYLAIKMELDHLIQTTNHGGDVQNWRAEEEEEMMIEELQRELNAKEETIKALKERVAAMEHEEYKKEREIDILRQSLRIMSSKKTASRVTKNLR